MGRAERRVNFRPRPFSLSTGVSATSGSLATTPGSRGAKPWVSMAPRCPSPERAPQDWKGTGLPCLAPAGRPSRKHSLVASMTSFEVRLGIPGGIPPSVGIYRDEPIRCYEGEMTLLRHPLRAAATGRDDG